MKFAKLALLTSLTVLLSGCTAALWESDRFARYHQPAKPTNLQLFHSADAGDFLVRYDEKREGSRKIQLRAYWLRGDSEPAGNPYKPHFVPVKESLRLAPVPMLESGDPAPPSVQFHAVAGTNSNDFTLYSGEDEIGRFALPEYMDNDGRTEKVLLTPFAILADILVVAMVAALISLPYLLENGSTD